MPVCPTFSIYENDGTKLVDMKTLSKCCYLQTYRYIYGQVKTQLQSSTQQKFDINFDTNKKKTIKQQLT